MYRLFPTFFDTPTHATPFRRWVPATDLVETDEHYVLTADLPGLTADDVTIDVTDGVLTVAGERKIEREVKSGGVVRLERASGSFARSLRLPKGIDADAISASFNDGVLEVKVPKPAEAESKKVTIKPKAA